MTESGDQRTDWPGHTEASHPDVFTTIPAQPAVKKAAHLSDQQLKQFFEEGVIYIEDFFEEAELQACRDDISVLVDDMANKLYKAGKIKQKYEDVGFFQRLIKLEEEFPGANIILHKAGRLPQAIRKLWSKDALLDIVEQLIGPDIAGHPVWNLRTKTPQNEATTVPWHQDAGYLGNDAYSVLQATAWIPLLDATEQNGCMQFVRGAHRSGRVCMHQCCAGNTWYVILEPEEIEKTLGANMKTDVVTMPVKYRGLLLFNNMIPHRSLLNRSDEIRWSLDLRWQNPKLPTGFFGLKDCVVMRTAENPNMEIDWETFDNTDRHQAAFEQIGKELDEFDVTIQGPWMGKWELIHMNTHTDAFVAAETAGSKSWDAPA